VAAEQVASGITEAFQHAELQKFMVAVCLLLIGNMMAKKVAGSASAQTGKAMAYMKKGARVGGRVGAGAVRGAGKGLGLDRAYNKAKDKALSVATRIPLVKGMAGDKLNKHRASIAAKEKTAAGMMTHLSQKERKSLSKGFGGSADTKARRKEALRANVLSSASKGPPKDPAKAKEWKKEFFADKKRLAKVGKKTGDSSIDKDLKNLEQKNPSLIYDKNEKDTEEKKRQAERLSKIARRKTGRQIGEMTKDDLSEELVMFSDPRALVQAGGKGTAEAKAALSKKLNIGQAELEDVDPTNKAEMKAMMDKVKKEQNRMKAGNFEILSDEDKAVALKGMTADQVGSLGNKGPDVIQSVIDNGRGKDLADNIDKADVKNLPNEIATAIRQEMVKSGDHGKAMESGGTVKEVFPSYNEGSGRFEGPGGNDDRKAHARVMESYDRRGKFNDAVSATPQGSLAKNGGKNDMAVEVLMRMDTAGLKDFASGDTEGKKTSEIITAAQGMQSMDNSGIEKMVDDFKKTLSDELSSGEMETEISQFTDRVQAAVGNAGEIVQDLEDNTNLRAQVQEMTFNKQQAADARQSKKEAKTIKGLEQVARKLKRRTDKEDTPKKEE
jgi:hypothetical protein